MSVSYPIATDHQLARLLQIGVVLEEVVEARSIRHYTELDESMDPEIEALLEEAASESKEHRQALSALIDQLEVESPAYDEVELLVEERYGRTKPEDFDGVLYDQLCNEETAFKFYDDLIEAIESSDVQFSIDRTQLLETLAAIREEEAEGVEEVTALMETRS